MKSSHHICLLTLHFFYEDDLLMTAKLQKGYAVSCSHCDTSLAVSLNVWLRQIFQVYSWALRNAVWTARCCGYVSLSWFLMAAGTSEWLKMLIFSVGHTVSWNDCLIMAEPVSRKPESKWLGADLEEKHSWFGLVPFLFSVSNNYSANWWAPYLLIREWDIFLCLNKELIKINFLFPVWI